MAAACSSMPEETSLAYAIPEDSVGYTPAATPSAATNVAKEASAARRSPREGADAEGRGAGVAPYPAGARSSRVTIVNALEAEWGRATDRARSWSVRMERTRNTRRAGGAADVRGRLPYQVIMRLFDSATSHKKTASLFGSS